MLNRSSGKTSASVYFKQPGYAAADIITGIFCTLLTVQFIYTFFEFADEVIIYTYEKTAEITTRSRDTFLNFLIVAFRIFLAGQLSNFRKIGLFAVFIKFFNATLCFITTFVHTPI